MPHQCTNCGREFPDGSKEMLSGCPDCGSNKFRFTPAERETDDTEGGPASDASVSGGDDADATATDGPFGEWPDEATPSDDRREPTAPDHGDWPDPPGSARVNESDTGADRPSPGTTADADRPSSVSSTPDPATTDEAAIGDPDAEPGVDADSTDETDETDEDAAQASARSEVVSPEELPEAGPADRTSAPTDPSSTDFERLREELNDQFESIRIVSPGTYELNLMELYDRQEYIISLREDGRYVIEMPGAWDAPDD